MTFEQQPGTLPPTILFADDEPSIRRLLEATLHGAPVRLLLAEDGAAALEIARAELPSLIVLDVAMPKMDGIEVCHALRSDEATRLIPIWLVSAYVTANDRRIQEAPADERIEKPFSPAALRLRITTFLGIEPGS